VEEMEEMEEMEEVDDLALTQQKKRKVSGK